MLSFSNLKNNYAFYLIIFIAFLTLITNICFCLFGIKNIRAISLKNYPSEKKVKKDYIEELKRLEKKEKEKDKKFTANIKKDKKRKKNNNFKKSKINDKIYSYKSRQSNKTLDISNSSNNKMSINIMIQPQINIYNNIKIEDSKNILEKNEDLNELPFSQAIYKDKRNFFQIFMSVIVQKLELINLIFGENKIKIILVYQYILSLIIDLFFNTFLYSDEIVSNKYHNNGKLALIASLTISLASNIITAIICNYLNFSKGLEERLEQIIDIKNEFNYLYAVQLFIKVIKIRVFLYFIVELFIISLSFYYIAIFCIVYNKSQISLLINYLISLLESLITSLIISMIIVITRKIGIIHTNNRLYNTSKYINNNF